MAFSQLIALTTAEYKATRLRNNLEKLPQELWDQIYNLTFTPSPGTRKLKSDAFSLRQDLNLLHVCPSSRALYAKTYYGNGAVFDLPADSKELTSWITMLTEEHRALVFVEGTQYWSIHRLAVVVIMEHTATSSVRKRTDDMSGFGGVVASNTERLRCLRIPTTTYGSRRTSLTVESGC